MERAWPEYPVLDLRCPYLLHGAALPTGSVSFFRMSPRSLNIWLGEPTEARAILQQEGLNYFLVEMDDTLRDVLLCSPLFSPDKIGDYLGIRWTDGTHFLLTWHGPGIEPLTPSFLEGYSKKVQAAPCGFVPLLQTLAGQVGKNPRWG